MSTTERIIMLIESIPYRKRSTTLEEKTGIKRVRWGLIHNRVTKPNLDDLDALLKGFPQYRLWLVSGQTEPETGQTSPELDAIKAIQEKFAGIGQDATERKSNRKQEQ